MRAICFCGGDFELNDKIQLSVLIKVITVQTQQERYK